MDTLEVIAKEVRAHAQDNCGFQICIDCQNFVPGDGDPQAQVMLIGEAPGAKEDAQGKPFVGSSGKLLDQLIESIGMTRDQVFITSVVKARPPKNRDPKPDEVAHYWPWLERQIAVLTPKLIVLLGRFALNRFFADARISEAHGLARELDGRVYLPVYHPAAALHRGSLRQTLFDDFAQIPLLLEAASQANSTSDAKTK